MAADEVQVYLQHQAQWQDELQQGKMFGVLIVQTTEGEIGYLAAFSGILAGKISILILFLPSTIYSNRTDSSRKKKNISPPSTTAYVSWKRIPLIRNADKHWKKKQHDAADSFHKPKPNWRLPKNCATAAVRRNTEWIRTGCHDPRKPVSKGRTEAFGA